MRTERIFGLDLLRAIVIIFVLIAHTTFIVSEKWDDAFTYGFGFLGVEIFFVLSGFLIGGILIKLTNSVGGLTFEKMRYFWMRRWFRTLPNYYLIFVISSINEILYRHLYNFRFLTFLLFIQNLTSPPPPFFNVSWSLSIEEWFYVVFPVICLLLYYIQQKWKISFNAVLFAIIIFMIGCLFLRISYAQFPSLRWDVNFRKIVILRLDAIAVGVLFALLKNNYPSIWLNYKKKMLLLGLSTFIALYAYFFYSFIFLGTERFFLKTFFFTLSSLSLAFTLPFFEQIRPFQNKNVNALILKFSLYSYSMYLIHGIIILFVNSKTATRILNLNDFIKFVLIWVIIYVVAAYQYKYFEKPLTDIRDRFKNHNLHN